VSEATHFLGEFHRIFPTIRIAMDALTKKVAQDGYVKTLFERRRSVKTCERDPAFDADALEAGWTSSALTLAFLFHAALRLRLVVCSTLHVASGSDQSRAAACRKVRNTLCQGSAADLVKAAMQRVLLALHRREPQPLYDETARMVMQMHDELVFEVKRERINEVAVRQAENCRNSSSAARRRCSPLSSAPGSSHPPASLVWLAV